MHYDWDFSVLAPYKMALFRGTLVSIELAFLTSVIGTILGIVFGGVFDYLPAKKLVLAVNDAFRSIPQLVLILFVYYFPYKEIFGVQPPNAFWCAVFALGFVQAVFTADLVIAAKHTIAPGPLMAARALGVPEAIIWRHIALPDIMRKILPSLIAFWIGNLKLSSLASVIGVADVVFVAQVSIGQQFRTLEAWLVVAAIYVILVTPCTVAARYVEESAWLKRHT
mgnify:CR=1 FL=1